MRILLLLLTSTLLAETGHLSKREGIEFQKTLPTLHEIQRVMNAQEGGIYFRYGDGELLEVAGERCMEQRFDPGLQRELIESLQIEGKNILYALPLYCDGFDGLEPGMYPGNHGATDEWCEGFFNIAKRTWKRVPKKVYSHAALSFSGTHYQDSCIAFSKDLKKAGPILFVGNRYIPEPLVKELFGNNCRFIKTPPLNAYDKIGQIEQTCLDHLKNCKEYGVVVTCMGAPGKALQLRLWKKHPEFFYFDYSSFINALVKIKTIYHKRYLKPRAWTTLTQFNGQEFLEKLRSSQ